MQPVSTRVAAVLGVDAEPLEVWPLALWPGEGQCFVEGTRVELSGRELELLIALASCPGHVVPRERLHALIWGETMPRRHRDVDVHVRRLRVKLQDAAPGWAFIHTHRQVGYRLWPERDEHR